MPRGRRTTFAVLAVTCALWAMFGVVRTASRASDTLTLSIVGTNDLHGRIFTDRFGRGGLPVLGGFVDNLRAARAADGGAVLLFDAGDTFQGGIESNLSEGQFVVDAYNAMGYTALAIGNHDFDYGPVDPRDPVAATLVSRGPDASVPDMRGALKAAAARARFPFLAANIIDVVTGRPVAWPNVSPSAIVEAAGVRVGLIGLMTATGLSQTLSAHVGGLRTTALASTVVEQAATLRQRGAEMVIVVAHEGGWCDDTSDARDLRSCDDSSEIFDLARRLPRGTVQAIVAGHTHGTVAHIVNDVPITSVPEGGGQFGRMDLQVEVATRRVTTLRVHRPRAICTRENAVSHACDVTANGVPVQYEGRVVKPSARVEAAMAPELARVEALRAVPLGAVADTPIGRAGGPETALGNLFADALRESVPGADVALSYGPGRGGLRADLPVGALTFGPVYDLFPFDNRVVRISVTGTQLGRALEDQLTRPRGGLLSVSGLRVGVVCEGTRPRVQLMQDNGRPLLAADRYVVAATSYSAGRAAWSAVEGESGVEAAEQPWLVRDVVATWLKRRGGRLRAADFYDPSRPRWTLPPQGVQC